MPKHTKDLYVQTMTVSKDMNRLRERENEKALLNDLVDVWTFVCWWNKMQKQRDHKLCDLYPMIFLLNQRVQTQK